VQSQRALKEVVGNRDGVWGRGVSSDVMDGRAVKGKDKNKINTSVQGSCREGRPGVSNRGLEESIVKNTDHIEVVTEYDPALCRPPIRSAVYRLNGRLVKGGSYLQSSLSSRCRFK
jgi:hypothetical protein